MDFIESGVDIQNREILLGDISFDEVAFAIKSIRSLERISTNPINLLISSYGGVVYEAFSLIDIMQGSPCKINTIGSGKLMSAGSLVFCVGDHRVAYSRTKFMLHELSSIAMGKLEDLKIEYKESLALMDEIYKIYAENSNKSEKYWKKKLKGVDVYMSAEEALAIGVVDEVIGLKKR